MKNDQDLKPEHLIEITVEEFISLSGHMIDNIEASKLASEDFFKRQGLEFYAEMVLNFQKTTPDMQKRFGTPGKIPLSAILATFYCIVKSKQVVLIKPENQN